MYRNPLLPLRIHLKLTETVGGGMPTSLNRTKWPVKGGAIALQPGWFQGHATAFIYVNLGEGTYPKNMSLPMVPPFQLNGPSRSLYNGTFCLPQVPLPANFTANIGDNATIQVIETAVHGAALYNVSFRLRFHRFTRLTRATVRGYHIRRSYGCRRGQFEQLLQL